MALAIIATVLVSVYKLHAQSLALARETSFYGIAPFLAQQKMAELIAADADLFEDESGDFGEDFPDFRWHVVMKKMDSGFQEKANIGFTRIDLTVSTAEDAYNYQLQTYRLITP